MKAKGATEFLRCLLAIGEGLKIGTLLQGCIDEHVGVQGRRRGLRVIISIAQLILNLLIEAQDRREGSQGGINIILRIDLQQLGLRQINFGKGHDRGLISACSWSVRRFDARLIREWSRFVAQL